MKSPFKSIMNRLTSGEPEEPLDVGEEGSKLILQEVQQEQLVHDLSLLEAD